MNVLLFLSISILNFDLILSIDMWSTYIDRFYMKQVLYPKLGEFVGSNGSVLSIGYEKYNNIDRQLANISAENWYIVDILDLNISTDVGQYLHGNLPSIVDTKKYFFRAIVDYGVLGFIPSKWNPSDITSHIESYQKLLEPDGKLFLKWDLAWPKNNPEMWIEIVPQLLKHLIPISSYLQIDHRCSPDFKMNLISKQNHILWKHEAIVNFGWTGLKSSCDAYLHSEWIPKHLL